METQNKMLKMFILQFTSLSFLCTVLVHWQQLIWNLTSWFLLLFLIPLLHWISQVEVFRNHCMELSAVKAWWAFESKFVLSHNQTRDHVDGRAVSLHIPHVFCISEGKLGWGQEVFQATSERCESSSPGRSKIWFLKGSALLRRALTGCEQERNSPGIEAAEGSSAQESPLMGMWFCVSVGLGIETSWDSNFNWIFSTPSPFWISSSLHSCFHCLILKPGLHCLPLKILI